MSEIESHYDTAVARSRHRQRHGLKRIRRALALAMGLSFLILGVAWADEPTFNLTIQAHRFVPEELIVPAGQRIKLVIHNTDATPEEFESHALNREKVIAAGATVILYFNPMQPGTYEFVGEFHEDTAKGRIIAK